MTGLTIMECGRKKLDAIYLEEENTEFDVLNYAISIIPKKIPKVSNIFPSFNFI